MWSTGRSEAALLAALPVPIEIRPVLNARRMRLRFDEGSGTLKLTCPARTSRAKALAWALDALWPFSRLVHAWSIPFQYLGRPYVLYRRRYSTRPAGR